MFITHVLFFVFVPAPRQTAQLTPSAFLAEFAAQEQKLLVIFRDDGIWTDHARVEELESYLEVASALRRTELLSMVVSHIDYMPKPLAPGLRLPPIEKAYPAYRCLRQAGMCSVKPLLSSLSAREFKTQNGSDDLKVKLAADCLVNILDGFFPNEGKHTARVLISAEAVRSDQVRKKRLQAVLNMASLR